MTASGSLSADKNCNGVQKGMSTAKSRDKTSCVHVQPTRRALPSCPRSDRLLQRAERQHSSPSVQKWCSSVSFGSFSESLRVIRSWNVSTVEFHGDHALKVRSARIDAIMTPHRAQTHGRQRVGEKNGAGQERARLKVCSVGLPRIILFPQSLQGISPCHRHVQGSHAFWQGAW